MPPLANKIAGKLPKKPNVPLWKGPSGEGDLGGITQSMIQLFLVCRERFRVKVIEGLQVPEGFRAAIEYGNMGHACEEAFALGQDWGKALTAYTQKLVQKYRTQQEQVVHWHHVCRTQFPHYIEYWSKHKDVKNREPVSSEHKFDVWYTLPSGRKVRLRGKMDSVDIITEGKKRYTWLQENKYKGDPNEAEIKANLYADLQSMMYLIALREDENFSEILAKAPLRGIRYKVIKRPLSGGKDSIRQHQPSKAKPRGESKEEFYARLGGLIAEKPEYYFMRWNAIVPASELVKFEQRILIPILEQICDWYEHICFCVDNNLSPFTMPHCYNRWTPGDATSYNNYIHWQHPFGVYNLVNEGGRSDVDEYLMNGSEVGLTRATELFPELKD
jgi:hypothetical protein